MSKKIISIKFKADRNDLEFNTIISTYVKILLDNGANLPIIVRDNTKYDDHDKIGYMYEVTEIYD